MTPRVRTEDLIDSETVAQMLGLSHRNSVFTYVRRYDDFPRPVFELGAGRVRLWLRPEVARWVKARKKPRPV